MLKYLKKFWKWIMLTFIIIIILVKQYITNIKLQQRYKYLVKKLVEIDTKYQKQLSKISEENSMQKEMIKTEYEINRKAIKDDISKTIKQLNENDKKRIDWLNKYKGKNE